MTYALAADVERIFLYRASDAGENEAWGLLQVDGAARPAERAFRFATELLAGVRSARRPGGDGIERIVLDRPGARLTVAWATGPADAPLVFDAAGSAPGPAARQDRRARHDRAATAGSCSRCRARARAAARKAGDYLIGGDPYVIVETVP